MIIGDTQKKFFNSLNSEVALDFEERKQLIVSDRYQGFQIVNQLIGGLIGADEAAIALDKLTYQE